MLNRYPLWKNVLIVLVLALGAIYAAPNLFPPDFAVQVSREETGTEASPAALNAAREALARRISLSSHQVLNPASFSSGFLTPIRN